MISAESCKDVNPVEIRYLKTSFLLTPPPTSSDEGFKPSPLKRKRTLL